MKILIDTLPSNLNQIDPETEAKFLNLVDIWRRETWYISSSSDLVNHPAYQEIMTMGSPIIPLLLRELERKSGHWFLALKVISGEDPVPPEMRGKIQQMIDIWLEWGRGKGYQW